MPAKDTDCKSHSADVEDCAADEQGEETEHSLKKLKLLDKKIFHFLFQKLKFLDDKVFHFLFRVPCIFFWFLFCSLLDIKVFYFLFRFPCIFFWFLFCLLLESDEFSRDLDELEEAACNGNELRVLMTLPGRESKNQHCLREGVKKKVDAERIPGREAVLRFQRIHEQYHKPGPSVPQWGQGTRADLISPALSLHTCACRRRQEIQEELREGEGGRRERREG